MNHAATYHIGHRQIALTAIPATAVAQADRPVRRVDRAAKGRQRNTERQTESSTNSNAADGFLKCSFLPKLKEPQTVQICGNVVKMERDFYQSLSETALHYHINPMETKPFAYPYNIALALYDAQKQLRNKVRDWKEIHLMQDGRKTYLTSEERYHTGATLYYIPVVPLYRLLKSPERKHVAQLLLSVCTYLCHNVGVPYYREEDSYLFGTYEMLKEWILYDEEDEETSAYISEIELAEWVGQWMKQKIYNSNNLNRFKERLNRFKCRNDIDQACFMLASKAFELYKLFPNEKIYRNARLAGWGDDEYLENIVTMDKYVSFCASTKGWLFENLFESVNNELQEYGQIEEPAILKRFDGSNITGSNLDFENRVFALIEDLTDILNNF